MLFLNIVYLQSNFVPMYKDIVYADDLSPDFLQEVNAFFVEWYNEHSWIEVYTSGSTGIPKKTILQKNNLIQSALATGRFFNFQPNQTILLSLSPKYIAGKLMIVRAIAHSMKLFVAPNQENPLLNLNQESVDFAGFVPYQVAAILKNEQTRKVYENIKQVIIGGAALNESLEDELRLLKNQSFATFGMTETMTHFALKDLSKKGSPYVCLPGISIEVDERSCLIIEKNKIFDRIVTNDLVEKISEKEFVWKGRADFVINSGGIKIHPELLEAKIGKFFPNNRFYFYGRASERFGQELILYIESDIDLDIFELSINLKQELIGYEFPKELVVIKKFELTPTGKIIRKLYE
jgi:O-succinylbenzoic acid--CoA ligase